MNEENRTINETKLEALELYTDDLDQKRDKAFYICSGISNLLDSFIVANLLDDYYGYEKLTKDSTMDDTWSALVETLGFIRNDLKKCADLLR